MYISRIKIKNYRNFQAFEMELKPFTVIIGENNIGKSNLMDAISLILANDVFSYRKRTLEIEDFNFECVKKFKQDVINPELFTEQYLN